MTWLGALAGVLSLLEVLVAFTDCGLARRDDLLCARELQFGSYTRDGVDVLAVAGELDLATYGAWSAALTNAFSAARALVVDFTRVGFCDVACAELLRTTVQRQDHRLGIAVAAVTRPVARVLDIVIPAGILPRSRSATEAVVMLAGDSRASGRSAGQSANRATVFAVKSLPGPFSDGRRP